MTDNNYLLNAGNNMVFGLNIDNYINDLLAESYINNSQIDLPTRLYNLIYNELDKYFDAYINFDISQLAASHFAFQKLIEMYYKTGSPKYKNNITILIQKSNDSHGEINMMINVTNQQIREKYNELKRQYNEYLAMDKDDSEPMFVITRAKLLDSINNDAQLLYYMHKYIKLMKHQDTDTITPDEIDEYNNLLAQIYNIQDPLNKIDLQNLAENL